MTIISQTYGKENRIEERDLIDGRTVPVATWKIMETIHQKTIRYQEPVYRMYNMKTESEKFIPIRFIEEGTLPNGDNRYIHYIDKESTKIQC